MIQGSKLMIIEGYTLIVCGYFFFYFFFFKASLGGFLYFVDIGKSAHYEILQ